MHDYAYFLLHILHANSYNYTHSDELGNCPAIQIHIFCFNLHFLFCSSFILWYIITRITRIACYVLRRIVHSPIILHDPT